MDGGFIFKWREGPVGRASLLGGGAPCGVSAWEGFQKNYGTRVGTMGNPVLYYKQYLQNQQGFLKKVINHDLMQAWSNEENRWPNLAWKKLTFVMLCAIRYNFYNLKKWKTPMEKCYF